MNTTSSPFTSPSTMSTLDHRFSVDTHQHVCVDCGEWEDCAELGSDDSACPRARGTVRSGGPFYCKGCAEERW